jgi:hypothetical protein
VWDAVTMLNSQIEDVVEVVYGNYAFFGLINPLFVDYLWASLSFPAALLYHLFL